MGGPLKKKSIDRENLLFYYLFQQPKKSMILSNWSEILPEMHINLGVARICRQCMAQIPRATRTTRQIGNMDLLRLFLLLFLIAKKNFLNL